MFTNAWILLFIFVVNGKATVVHDIFETQCECQTVLKILQQGHNDVEHTGYCKPGTIKYSLQEGKPYVTITRQNMAN